LDFLSFYLLIYIFDLANKTGFKFNFEITVCQISLLIGRAIAN